MIDLDYDSEHFEGAHENNYSQQRDVENTELGRRLSTKVGSSAVPRTGSNPVPAGINDKQTDLGQFAGKEFNRDI